MNQSQAKLGFSATWAMAVGGMIGGGIFSTLGVVVGIAGPWAWLSFAVASVALVARLSVTDPLALAFLGVLTVIALFGRPALLHHVRTENRRS